MAEADVADHRDAQHAVAAGKTPSSAGAA